MYPWIISNARLDHTYLDELNYYPFIINKNRFYGRCNTVEDPLSITYVPNKIENMKLKVFDMVKEVNESKTLANVNLDVNLMLGNVTREKNEIAIRISVTVKNQ